MRASATDRVRETLAALGIATEIVEFPQGTRTAQDAATAIGTTLGQIVKSLVFLADGRPVLVLTGKGKATRDAGGLPEGTLVFPDLAAFAAHLVP